jgi:SET domain-containing protein
MSQVPYHIQVKRSEVADGNGVFALKDFRKGELIEVCPAIFMPIQEFEIIKQTKMFYYFFEYSNKEFAIVLGYGSIYNHLYQPNAQYRFNYRKRVMVVRAIKPIKSGEEIFFNYNFYADDKTPLESWFLEGVDKNHLG